MLTFSSHLKKPSFSLTRLYFTNQSKQWKQSNVTVTCIANSLQKSVYERSLFKYQEPYSHYNIASPLIISFSETWKYPFF